MAKPSIQVFLDKLLQNHRMVLNPVLRGIEQRHIRIGPNAVEKILHGSRTPQLIDGTCAETPPNGLPDPRDTTPAATSKERSASPTNRNETPLCECPEAKVYPPAPEIRLRDFQGRKPVSAVLPYSS